MTQAQITALLGQSLRDQRIDVDEKHQLFAMLSKLESEEKNYLRNQAFDLVRNELQQGAEPARLLKWLEQVTRLVDKSYNTAAPIHSHAYFSPGDACRNAIVSLLKSARQRVDICVFTISDDRISNAIETAHQRGVRVRVITDNDKANDRGSDVYELQQNGVDVCMDASANHMHHKFALIDNRLVNGSFNWTRSASAYNQENIPVPLPGNFDGLRAHTALQGKAALRRHSSATSSSANAALRRCVRSLRASRKGPICGVALT